MTNASIRVRLTVWYSAVLLLGLALFGLGMWLALEQRLIAGVDTRLAQRMQGLRGALGAEAEIHGRDQLQQELAEFAGEVPDGTLIQLRDQAGGIILPFPTQTAFDRDLASSRTVSQAGKPFRVVTDRIRTAGEMYDVLLAASLDEVTAVMRDFRQLLFLMIPAVLAMACLGGYWLSSRALRPVDEITKVAKLISVQNLSQRIAVPRTGDEIERMSETWNQVLERLDVAVNRIRQFTADASHELRTPLGLIRATAELALRRERSPEEYRKSLSTIESEAEHMTALTESLLTVARADAGGFEMALEPTDLSELVNSVVRQNEGVAAEKGICLTAETNGHTVFATANDSGLRRLLLILIDNALKHTPAGGRVTVSADTRDGGAVLSVADTGAGIPADALPHIFERFYRGDPARGSGSGFGLGLSIAQAIAKAHGGHIAVDSSPGAGARFSLRW
ncbi:MAG: HAMP domain-containing protein [Acidobacteriia bacterium]|nr:HAMP domain-containing protein [Terriglobia bacterium]